MWPFKQLVEEWPTISAAPTTYLLTSIALAAIAFVLSSLWYRKQIADARGTIKLCEATIALLKAETDRMSKEISDLRKSPEPPAYNHVFYGSTKVMEALVEIEEKKTMRFSGNPSDWTPETIEKFAALGRVKDAGAAKISFSTVPQQAVVTSTSSAHAIQQIVVTRARGTT